MDQEEKLERICEKELRGPKLEPRGRVKERWWRRRGSCKQAAPTLSTSGEMLMEYEKDSEHHLLNLRPVWPSRKPFCKSRVD